MKNNIFRLKKYDFDFKLKLVYSKLKRGENSYLKNQRNLCPYYRKKKQVWGRGGIIIVPEIIYMYTCTEMETKCFPVYINFGSNKMSKFSYAQIYTKSC